MSFIIKADIMKITDLPEQERPREKLVKYGADSLSDSEILAILLRHGIAKQSAIAMAHDLIEHFGSLRQVIMAPYQDFCAIKGLGLSHYAQFQAALSLGQRLLEQALPQKITFNNYEALAKFLLSKLSFKARETFAVLFLNTKLELIAYEELFQGTVSYATVHPREIVRRALAHNATALILAHNHPSGDPTPSKEDLEITQILQDSLQWLDIKIVQHLIVGNNVCEAIFTE